MLETDGFIELSNLSLVFWNKQFELTIYLEKNFQDLYN